MKDRIIRIVKIIISLILMYVLLSQIEYGEIKLVVKEIKISSILAAVIIYNISVFFNAVKWKILLPKARVSFLTYLSFRAQFYSTVLPGQLFGEASKLTVWKEQEEDITRVTASVIYDRTTGIIGQMIIAAIGFSFSKIGRYNTGKWWFLWGIIAILVFMYFSTEKHVVKLIEFIIDTISKKSVMLVDKMHELYAAWCYFSKDKKILMLSVLWGIINQVMGSILIFYLSKTIGLAVGFFDYCWIMPIISLILLIPISFAGLGLRDASLASILALYKVPSSKALVVSTSLLLGQIVAAVIGGVLILIFDIRGKRSK